MDLRSHSRRLAVAVAFFMFLQLASGTPFFGVSVQGGFQAEADIASSARAVGVVILASQQSMVTFASKLSLSTAAQNATAGAVLQMYNLFVANIATFTDRISWAAVNTTNTVAEVFLPLETAFNNAATILQQETPAIIASITSYSSSNGAKLGLSVDNVLLILADISRTLSTFGRTITTFSRPIMAKEIFEKLTKSQIATLVGALDALKAESTVVVGKLKETATILTESDTLMSSYISMMSETFSNVDVSLSSLFNRLSGLSQDFLREFRASDTTVSSNVQAFNTKIRTFREDIIFPASQLIIAITRVFSEKYSEAYTIIKPNVEEKLQLMVNTAADTVLNEVQNLLFTTYRVLDSVMRRIPSVPSKGRTCATEFINPYVQYLSSNMASSFSGCISSTTAQVEPVLRGQLLAIDALVKDRLAYIKMRNDALNGISSTSDSVSRAIAVVKLTAQTSNQAQDVFQPALASIFSFYAQLVSNLDAVLNRSKLCVTLKSTELSAQLITASTNFNTCMDS
uniref:Protein TsetseEP domain-containing protein n=1 Tax=Anopheles culicifacies TaxID=139723 RepID=A0A182MEX6_9DIPT